MNLQMNIDKKIKKLFREKNKSRKEWCKGCDRFGCDDVDNHSRKLMQFAYELGKKQ